MTGYGDTYYARLLDATYRNALLSKDRCRRMSLLSAGALPALRQLSISREQAARWWSWRK